MMQKLKVQTEYGDAHIESLKISELGYVQIRLYYPDKKRWITYTVRDGIEKLINGLNIKVVE